MTVMLVGLAVVGVGVAGVSAASAAGLGGLMASDFGADRGSAVSCDADGVSIEYTTEYQAPSQRYVVSAVTVGGLAPDCTGKALSVTLGDSAGGLLSTGTAVSGGISQAVTMVPAADVTRVMNAAIVVTG